MAYEFQGGTEFLVNTSTNNFQQGQTIARLANGGFVITWSDLSNALGESSSGVKAQMYDANGVKVGGEFRVNTNVNGDQLNSGVAGLNTGGFVVTWTELAESGDGSLSSIKAQLFDAVGAQVGTEFVVNTNTLVNQQFSKVTTLADGRFVITWEDNSGTLGDSSGLSIKAQMFNANGTRSGSEFLVNTQTAESQQGPTITALSNGGFVVSWYDFDNPFTGISGKSTIRAQVFDANGAKVGAQLKVNTLEQYAKTDPSVAGLSDGGFVITWLDNTTQGDGSGYSIKAQVFTATGTKLGSEFLVNTQTVNNQMAPQVTGLTNGGFVVTWYDHSGTLGDSYESSIKAQAYDANGAKMGTEFLVNVTTQGAQTSPRIAAMADGGFAVTWTDHLKDGSSTGVMARIFELPPGPSIANDTLVGTAGNDVIDGLAGRDAIDGLGGHDRLNGAAGNDTLSGREGNDTLDGGAGLDTVSGGAGDDLIWFDGSVASTADVVDGGDGNDTVYGTLNLQGSAFTNVELLKVMYSTTLSGTAAQFSSFQTIDHNSAQLKLTGGGTLDLTGRALSAVSLESTGTGSDVTGSVYNDTLTGNYLDTLHGGEGNDRLTGGKMYGDAGNDTIYGAGWGGDGDDAFRVWGYELGPVYFDGGDGVDAIYAAGSLKNFNFTSVETLWVRYDTENLKATVAQLNGFQWIGSEGAPLVLTSGGSLDLSSRALSGISLYAHKDGNTITGSQYNDRFMGQGGRYIFYGGGGKDNLSGGGTLYGEDGNDTLSSGSKDSDTLDGGSGDDLIFYGGGVGAGGDLVNGGVGNDTLDASGDISGATVTGIEVLNIGNFVNFKATAAQLNGFNTILQTSSGSLMPTVTLTDGGTVDLTGKSFNAIHIKASDAGNNITGDRDHDSLYGGAGNDTLNGGGGDDYLNGGAGDDLFIHSEGSNSLVGGTGQGVDVALYDGVRADYDVTVSTPPGTAFVYDLRNSNRTIHDRTWEMEYLVFADGYLSLTAGTTDGNDMPERIAPQSILADGTEDTAYVLSLSQLTKGFGDPENDVLGVEALSADHGTIIANPDGGFSFVPDANYSGPVVVSNQVTDGHGGSTPANLSLTLAAVNDAPLLTGTPADLADGTRGAAYGLTAADLLAGYSDAEGDVLSVVGLAADSGVVTDNGDGTFTLTPEAGYAGQVKLTYTISDGHGGTAAAERTVIFVAGDQSLTGSDGADNLNGADGNDTLRGLAGDDVIDGGAGNDSMYGGLGDDFYTVDAIGDKVIELTGQGIDTVYALLTYKASGNVENVYLGAGNISAYGNALGNLLIGNFGNNTLSGADGDDTLQGLEGNDKVDGGAGHDELEGGEGNDSVLGGDGSDALDGGNGNDNLNGGTRWDTLNGGHGDDILDGGADNDQMFGSAGNDTYVVDHAGDRVYEYRDEGADTVKASIAYSLTADVENLFLTGTGHINGTGNGLSNSLNGNSGNNGLSGGLGNDSLYGWDGNDNLSGGNDHDRLSGGNGNDTLIGGHGNDVLGGGAGADDFVFSTLSVNGHDHIVDFQHGTDRLVFVGTNYGFTAGYGLAAAEFTVGTAAVGWAAQFIWDNVTHHLYFDSDGLGAGEAIELAMISGGATVTKDDIHFV